MTELPGVHLLVELVLRRTEVTQVLGDDGTFRVERVLLLAGAALNDELTLLREKNPAEVSVHTHVHTHTLHSY